MNEIISPKCPKCGVALPADAPQGLCPRCLGALNLATETLLTGEDAVAALPPLTPEELAPHFPQLEIIECLGRGGMGVVYKARQKSLNRLVALKLLAPEREKDEAFAGHFAHEAHALAGLNHPNIVTVYDFGQAGGFFFLLMEFVDGVNLRQAMKVGHFTPEQALAIVPPICDALQYAHEHGIVHRDIKPENLLLDKGGRVKIADFGIAKIVASVYDRRRLSPEEWRRSQTAATTELTDAGRVMGTPQYMAPEQKEHRATDHRADIYSLGVVLYEMLTGELPADKLQPPSRKVQIDVRLDEIVLRALEKSPELRYQTAGEFRTRVETMAQTPPAIPSAAIRTEGGSSDVSANQRAVEAARRMVAAPATCLLVVGCLNLLFFLMCCLWFPFFTIRSDSGHPIITHYNSPQPATLGTTGLLLILYFSALVMLVFSALNMRRLQHYGMSVAASILAMITPPGFLLGLPFGIWSLIVLARRDVREAFESPVPPKLPWPRRKLIKVGGSLLGAAGLILLGAGIICFAWPRSYSARCVFEITDWSAEKGATAVQLATRGMAARKDYSLDVLVIRGTDLVQVTAWAKDPRTAADAANAAYDRVKTGFANLPNEKLTLREKAAPPATYSKPNIPGIIGVTSFLLVPPFALPGIILLLVGLFRQGDKAQEVGRNGHESRAQNATTRTDSDSGDSAANQRTVETAQRMVAAPATCLLVVGCLNLLFFLMCCSWFLLTTRSDSGQPNISNHDLPQPATAATAGLPLILYFCAMVMLVFSALNMRRLQHYGMSVAGSILAMITPPGFLLGLPFGIWSLIVLARRDVREAFEFAVPPPRPPKPPWPRKRLIKTGTSLLGAAGLILLGAGIICWAWPRSYSARCVISTNGSSGLKAATVIQYATQGTPTPKDYSLEMVAIRNTSLVQVTAWANDPRTAADAANAAWDRVKAGFANKPDERVTLIEKAEPPATYAKPNIRGIIRVTAFFLVPPFALPGIILLLVGLFRRGEKTPPPLEGNEAEWRNPANWTGPVYFSKRDSRVWVPKRGHPAFGWTVNFGRAWGLALIACILLAGLVISNSFIGYFAAKQKPATGKTVPPATPSEPSRVSHTGPPFVAQLAQGTVELIGVAPHPSANASSWYPDGSPSKKRFPSPRMVLDDESQAEGKIMKEIAFRVHSRVGLRSTPVVHFDKESGVSEEGTESNFEEDSDGQTRSILVLSIACPPEAKKMNLKIKVASGDWEKALTLGKLGSASSSGRSGSTRSGWTKVGTWELHAETITGKDGDVTLALNSSGGDDFETRMVSVKTDGTVSPVQGKSSHSVGGVISSLIKMTADEYSQIKEFQLQKRPYQWVEFRNVSLQLGHKTLVEIVNAPGSETSQVAPAATFGPVIERVIRSDSFLNLDTGNYVEPPKEILDKMGIRFAAGASKIIEDDRRITEWAQASGADLTPGIPEKEGSMALWGGILSPNGSVRLKFDTATPGDVSSQLDETEERLTQGVKPLPTLTWLGGASFGSTFLFQTREGSRGLLQFLGSGPKGGIRVRYKLVQGTGGSRAR